MTESQEPTPTGEAAPAGKPGRYSRSTGGLLGAMIVTVVVVLGWVGFRALTTDAEPTPVRTVDYVAIAKAARADGAALQVIAPDPLPSGWKATSATYAGGPAPAWHLGMLTDQRKYVGVEEARSSLQDLVEEHVDPDARRGKDVDIGGETWQSFTDAGGDYAVGRSDTLCGDTPEARLVVGTAPPEEIRALAGSLTGEVDCAKVRK